MANQFDISTDEKVIMEFFTRSRPVVTDRFPDAYSAWFVVGDQMFQIGPVFGTINEADWMRWVFTKALMRAGVKP